MPTPKPGKRDIQIPTIDISAEMQRRVIVAAGTAHTYQGHPTTVLLPDGRTMFCVWTVGHGGPCGPLKRSDDAGLTWSSLLQTPDNWKTVRNCPAIYRLPDPRGRSRLFVFAGQGPDGTMQQAVSEDDGRSWSPMTSNGLTCVMPFCAVVPVDGGRRLLGMTNIRRPGDTTEERSNVVAQSVSLDGGFTWSEWEVVVDIPGCKICEPELIRSPDGAELLCLMRENNRDLNGWVMVSGDEGTTWSEPRQLPAAVSGDRHAAAYAPDGRLVVCFRDTARQSPTRDHFVAWVGTYDELLAGAEGRYRVQLLTSYAGPDCGYPGLECLPDGTFVATTYIKWAPGPEKHSVVSVRFTLDELDSRIRAGTFFLDTGSAEADMPETADGGWEGEIPDAPDAPVPLTEEPQLFVDDVRIAYRRDVTRTVHAATKLPEPVLETEMPWEGGPEDRRLYVYGTVLRDAETGLFRMWYNRMSHVLYATSRDGLHWDRPELGLTDWRGSRDNNILPVRFHSPSVIFDPSDSDPEGRYKMLGHIHRQGYGAARSPDGLTWTPVEKNPVLPHGDTCTLAQDPATGEFLAFHKIHRRHRGHPRRLVYLATSTDMQTWSEPRLVMAPDEIDDAQTVAEGGRWSEFYNMSAFPYGGQFLGLVTHFRFSGTPPRPGPGQSPDDGPIDVQLVHSRDGRNWERLQDRRPVIPNGPYAYDAGAILGVANRPVAVGDEVWLYYTAITTTHGGFLPEKVITIARAAWRLDGFVSLDAGTEEGLVETVPLRPRGDRLTVNADAAGGEVRVGLLDEEGNAIAGYEAEHCIALRSDSVRHTVRWQNRDRLPADTPVALAFHLRNASLYSFRSQRRSMASRSSGSRPMF